MPRAVVVLPSTTYRAGDFVSAAEALGIDLVVASEQPPPFEMGDRYLHIDCSDPAAAAEAVARLGNDVPLDGVVAADDSGVVVAAIAGTSLGLLANPPDAAAATRDKLAMRRRLSREEVPQPRFIPVEANTEPARAAEAIGYPLVVKPLNSSASQGVVRVDRPEDLETTVHRVRQIVQDPEATILFESYLSGEELAVEGLLRDGELTVLAVFDKPVTLAGPFFPETILVTPSGLTGNDIAECIRVSESALRALGLVHGPVHIELKIDDGRASVLEVAARSIGGLCSRSLNFGLMGTTLETLILRNAVGMDKPELTREPHASGVLMIPIPAAGTLASVEGVDTTRSTPGVTGVELTIRPGEQVLPPPDGDRYLGFVFARGETAEGVEAALRKAMDTIEVRVES